MAKNESKGAAEESLVPEATVEALHRTLDAVDDLQANLNEFLSIAEPDVLAELHPLQRARAFLLLAKSTSALLSVRLRCSGICPDDHPIKSEFERLSLFEDKLERFTDWDREPLRRSTTLNSQAATRFIEHSLPDLTQEQRKSMRDISRGQVNRNRFDDRRTRKKRKHQTTENLSVRSAAQEFLEKAAQELFGSNDHGVKGPLRNETSDEEDAQIGT
ncbi:exosome complex protein LRP1 protein [Dioscorea alata]|uniref:Exosome complex protein LRP1 protein n=1 Tax=Dioscorea alata TaxID=55571 RepID=A0ACB7UHZ7_DIOAL|nr:exosome complex protein LRP1 protein [Dioscorea alata]